jgi:hypothetical protein
MMTIIKTKDGLKVNKTLNKLAEKLEKTYKSPNLKFGFTVGQFDGIWEFTIKNIKTNKGLVLKQDPRYNNCQMAYVYLRSIDDTNTQTAQPREDLSQYVRNTDLLEFCKRGISSIAK